MVTIGNPPLFFTPSSMRILQIPQKNPLPGNHTPFTADLKGIHNIAQAVKKQPGGGHVTRPPELHPALAVATQERGFCVFLRDAWGSKLGDAPFFREPKTSILALSLGFTPRKC